MKTPNPDVDPFVEALRGDLPSADAEARVRARLLAAGVVVTGASLAAPSLAAPSLAAPSLAAPPLAAPSAAAPSAAAPSLAAPSAAAPSAAAPSLGVASAGAVASGAAGAVAGGSLAAGAPAALVKAGLSSKVLVLPVSAKIGVATTLAVAVAATSAPLVLQRDEPARDPASDARAVATSDAGPRRQAAPDRATRARALPPELASAPEVPLLSVESVPADAARPADADRRRASGAQPRATKGVTRRPSDTAERRSERSAEARRMNGADSTATTGVALERVHPSSLGEEARLIERAMVALGEGDRELARHALEEHARRFPDGLLRRERERAFARLLPAARPPATDTLR